MISGQLLVGHKHAIQLHVYTGEGKHVGTLNLPRYESLFDAVWTLRSDDILCLTDTRYLLVINSLSGDVIASSTSQTYDSSQLSVSPDSVIYLSHSKTGIFQSNDSGMTWSHLVKNPNSKWEYKHAIKVSTNNYSADTWVIIESISISWPECWLRIYTTYKYASANQTWRDVTVPSSVQLGFGKLAFEGRNKIFTTDAIYHAVHMWSVNGSYVGQLVPAFDRIKHSPISLAMNRQRQVMT